MNNPVYHTNLLGGFIVTPVSHSILSHHRLLFLGETVRGPPGDKFVRTDDGRRGTQEIRDILSVPLDLPLVINKKTKWCTKY